MCNKASLPDWGSARCNAVEGLHVVVSKESVELVAGHANSVLLDKGENGVSCKDVAEFLATEMLCSMIGCPPTALDDS